MNFEAVIGIEIHVEMKTKSKMFSCSYNSFGDDVNTNISPVDMAFPGSMPVVNKQAVINAIRVCNALHMSIDQELWFDRKNYFYSDLPKGYQITQQARPIGSSGYVEIEVNGENKRIHIERLHMEEDTCKQLHLSDCSLLDYNRAGTPLVEIVSLPEMRNGEEASKYVDAIKAIVVYADVSDGKMEEGSLRCDVNISLREVGSTKFGTKVEIKNLNSTANVERAIDYEIKRQAEILNNGGIIEQETRRFDETNKCTVLMRKKTDSVDYKYFTEPNIPPIYIDDEFVKNAIESCPELADSKIKRYKELGLSSQEAHQMIADKDLTLYFDRCLKYTNLAKACWNFLVVDVVSYLNKRGLKSDSFTLNPELLVKLLQLIDKKEISYAQGRKVFECLLEKEEDPSKIVERLGLKQNSNEGEIKAIVEEVLKENPQSVIDFRAGKDRAVGFIIGQVMKKSRGKANPQIASKLVNELLKTWEV